MGHKNHARLCGVAPVLLLALVCAVFIGCTAMQKLSAASIIKKTELSIDSVAADSLTIYTELFPKSNGFLPDPQVVNFVQNLMQGIIEQEIGKVYLTVSMSAKNNHTDTLWLKALDATLKLDTLATLPVELKDSVKLVPGDNSFSVQTAMPIDGSIFHLKEVDTLYFAGRLDVTLKGDGEIVPLEFDMKKSVSPEEKKAISDKAKKYVMDELLGGFIQIR